MSDEHQAESLGPKETGVSRAQLSRILGVNTRTIYKLEADQIIAPSERGRGGKASVFVLEDCVPKYIRYVSSVKPAGEDSRSRRDKSQAELNELLLAQRRGEVVPREQVIAENRIILDRVAKGVRSLPSRQVQEGLASPENLEKNIALAEEVVAILNDLKTYQEPK